MSIMSSKWWKKSFNNCIIILVKMRRCDECKGEKICITCNSRVNENKKIKANSIILKRRTPCQFGYMLSAFLSTFLLTFRSSSAIIYACFLLSTLYTEANF